MTEESNTEDMGAPNGEQSTPKPDETLLMREQLEEALREKGQFRAMAQRAQADLFNYRRRAAEEREELRRTANSQLLLKVLSVVDDLGRAITLIPEDAMAPGWLEGLHLVRRNLDNVLESEGVTSIEAEGHSFEPREHEAVHYQETPDGKEGIVIRVIRNGYKLNDRVLRAAQVTVSKAPDPENKETITHQEA